MEPHHGNLTQRRRELYYDSVCTCVSNALLWDPRILRQVRCDKLKPLGYPVLPSTVHHGFGTGGNECIFIGKMNTGATQNRL